MPGPRASPAMKAQTVLVGQPEQPALFAQSREQFESVLIRLSSNPTCQMTHSEVERLVNTEGTELMRRLLQDHLCLRARQEQEQGLSGPVRGVDQVPRTHQPETDGQLMKPVGALEVAVQS